MEGLEKIYCCDRGNDALAAAITASKHDYGMNPALTEQNQLSRI